MFDIGSSNYKLKYKFHDTPFTYHTEQSEYFTFLQNLLSYWQIRFLCNEFLDLKLIEELHF